MALLSLFSNKWVMMAVAIGIFLFGLWAYFTWSQNQIAELNQQLSAQAIQIETQHATIDALKTRMKVVEDANRKFDESVKIIRTQTMELNKLYNQKFLTIQASKKPLEVETRINDATKKLFDELSIISKGAQ